MFWNPSFGEKDHVPGEGNIHALTSAKGKAVQEHSCLRQTKHFHHTGSTRWHYFESNIDITDWGTRFQNRRLKCHSWLYCWLLARPWESHWPAVDSEKQVKFSVSKNGNNPTAYTQRVPPQWNTIFIVICFGVQCHATNSGNSQCIFTEEICCGSQHVSTPTGATWSISPLSNSHWEQEEDANTRR